MLKDVFQWAYQHQAVTILVIVGIVCIIVVAEHRSRWRELYEATELVRNNPPVEKKSAPYGHRLVWQGPYWDVEFKLDDGGAVVMHSDGHEKGRLVGPLWWLRVDKKNPNGFYRRFRDEAQRPVPFGIRRKFADLVQLAKEKGEQFTPA